MALQESILSSALSEQLKIKHPIILAGMAVVASPPLAAAVSNAGGLGVIGAGFPSPSPENLRKMIEQLQELLDDKTAFGVDLLFPQVGNGARKTNKDYTKGAMPEMIDVICESRCRLFVCAVGIPPRWAVDKLHAAGIPVMNMIGSPKHVPKALQAGVDIICAQGTEAGGHTGDIGTMVLIPQVVRLCHGHKNGLNGGPVHVVAAGGMYNGQTMAAAFALGAEAVWVGTRFVASEEATTTKLHKKALIEATSDDTVRTVIYTGRPARMYKTPYVRNWEEKRQDEIASLTAQGIVPYGWDQKQAQAAGKQWSIAETAGHSFGQSCGDIHEIKSAASIVKEMVHEAVDVLRAASARVRVSKL